MRIVYRVDFKKLLSELASLDKNSSNEHLCWFYNPDYTNFITSKSLYDELNTDKYPGDWYAFAETSLIDDSFYIDWFDGAPLCTKIRIIEPGVKLPTDYDIGYSEGWSAAKISLEENIMETQEKWGLPRPPKTYPAQSKEEYDDSVH